MWSDLFGTGVWLSDQFYTFSGEERKNSPNILALKSNSPSRIGVQLNETRTAFCGAFYV